MKIAICINHFSIGGVGTSTYILASGLRKASHQADILATDWRPGDDFERARIDGWPVEAICLGVRWLRRRLEITLERLSTYDVVINNHSTETKLILPALPDSMVRLSVIRSTNDPVIFGGKSSSPYVDALVGISPEVQRLLKATMVECRTEMIANAIMVLPTIVPTLKAPLSLAYLGRLTDVDKNILILPDIAQACKKRGIKLVIDVAGEGKDRQKLEDKIKEHKVSECFRMHGVISHDDVGSFLSKRQFGIFPSNYEGFGLSLAEAMATGTVPVASDIPSYRWILGKDADTLCVPTNDANAYAERICALAADPENYQQIQERLQQRQQENFSPTSTVEGYLRLIEELKKTHDPDRFCSVPLAKVPLNGYNRLRYSRAWRVLQKMRYGLWC